MILLQNQPALRIKSDMKKQKRLKLVRRITYFKEYTQLSTIHGIQHIFKDGETIWHRLIWTAFFLISFGGGVYLMWNSWEGYVQYPVQITVIDTLRSLNGELFPAITICPSHKLITSKAKDYLRKHSINEEILNDPRIEDYLSALVLFQHPLFYQMQHFLHKSQPILKYLSGINTTDLMYMAIYVKLAEVSFLDAFFAYVYISLLQAAPKCEDIFIQCWWQGKPKKCCKTMFHLQRSEVGFCYSFNSLTSEKHKNCNLEDENNKKNGCRLKRHNLVATGPTTGAEIFIKIIDSLFLDPIDFTGGTNVRVQTHHPYELPESGVGILVPIENLNEVDIAIKVTITKSSNEIRGLKLEDRGCLFKNEIELNITKIYSQTSCLIECRLKYVIKKCRCLPYYFNNFNGERNLPVCSSLQMKCIGNLNEDLRFYKPPNINIDLHDEETRSALDCTHCLPTCNEIKYEFISELTKNFYVTNNHFDGFIDVYLKSAGAVTYQREVSFNAMNLLVNLGGIGGLFLGGSLLSILEIIFWFSKATISYFFTNYNLINKKKKQVKASVVQAWVK